MGLFGGRDKRDKIKIGMLERRVKELEDLCEEKDSFFSAMISDGLRHGSSIAGKHMADKKKYNNKK